jgi:hypothetical protein
MALARRWVPFQPVPWPGTSRSTPKSAKAATVGSMRGSKTAPVRWKPPTKPTMRSRPVRRRALWSTLTAPAWEQPDTTTRPLPATSTTRFWSSRISGSLSQPSPARVLWVGKPTSNSVTLGT